MLFRIWICAFSDIGSTAPTSLPDSMSMSEGMPSSDGFSRLLRKLANGYLLVESFSARLWRYFRGNEPEGYALYRKHTIRILHIVSILHLIVTAGLLSILRGHQKRRKRSKITKRSAIEQSRVGL